MKILILILLLLFPSTLGAQDNNDYLFMGLGNDYYNFFPTLNRDDQLSYKTIIDYKKDSYNITLDMGAVTNRGWKDNWQDNGESSYTGRYDIIDLKVKKSFNVYSKNGFNVFVNPEVGIKLIGGYDLILAQDFLHDKMEIPSLNLKYEENIVSPTLNLEATAVAALFQDNIEFTLKLENSIFYQTSQDFILSYDFRNIFDIALGHSLIQPHSKNKTHELLTYFSNGTYITYELNTGVVELSLKERFKDRQGFGIISINALSFFNEKTYENDDYILTIGFNKTNIGNYLTLDIKFPLSDELALGYRGQIKNGKAILDEKTLDIFGNNYARLKTTRTSSILSLDYYYDLDMIRPYVRLGLGATYSNFTKYTNSLKTAHSPIEVDKNYLSPIINLNAGLSILPKDFLILKNNSIRFIIAYNLDVFPLYKMELDYYNKNLTDEFKTNDYDRFINLAVSSISLGVEIGVDIQ